MLYITVFSNAPVQGFQNLATARTAHAMFGGVVVAVHMSPHCLPVRELQHIFLLLRNLRLIHLERGSTPPKKLVSCLSSRCQTRSSPLLHHRSCGTRVDTVLNARTCRRRICWRSTFPLYDPVDLIQQPHASGNS